MRTIVRIMKTELKVLFYSPIAWMILVVFAFQMGIEYCGELTDQLRYTGLGYSGYNLTTNLMTRMGVISKMLSNLYLYIPLLTMGLMSRELSSGSIKLLYSSPISNSNIILGKYFSVIIYSLILVVLILVPTCFSLFAIVVPDVPAILTAILGMFLTMAAYAAIGLFMSTITKYQVVAAVGTLGLLAVLNFIGNVGQETEWISTITYWLSIRGRSEVFIEGMICTKDLLYFLLIIFLFISLSIIKLQGERLKLSKLNSSLKYLSVIVIALLVGYVSSLPTMILYYDSTAAKTNTLTEESQEVMKRLDGKITLTTYANFLDDTWLSNSFSSRNYDLSKFDQFIRFRPDMEIKYVYYWGKGTNPNLDKKYPDLTTEERFYKQCEIYDYNPKRFISHADIKDDISLDNGRFVRTIRSSNGKVAYLRKFEDMYVDPFESEIAAAFKTLIDKSPVIAFVTGHGERDAYDHGDKGYGPFATNVKFRNALINQGFTVRKIVLSDHVADDVDVIVISDMKSGLTPQEEVNFDDYLQKGGNLLIMGEPRRQEFMNPIIAKMGLKFSDGIVVTPSDQYLDDIVPAQILPTSIEASKYFQAMVNKGYNVITPSACAVEVIDSTFGYKITPILNTADKGSWIEYQTTDFLNEKSTIDANRGEVERSNELMLYLRRQVNGKEQRIFVGGDADCMATSALTTDRPGLNGNNFGLITELFRNMSYEQYPMNGNRVRPPDNKFLFNEGQIQTAKFVMIWALPILLLIGALTLLMSRKRR